jgi:hypothetical protein
MEYRVGKKPRKLSNLRSGLCANPAFSFACRFAAPGSLWFNSIRLNLKRFDRLAREEFAEIQPLFDQPLFQHIAVKSF